MMLYHSYSKCFIYAIYFTFVFFIHIFSKHFVIFFKILLFFFFIYLWVRFYAFNHIFHLVNFLTLTFYNIFCYFFYLLILSTDRKSVVYVKSIDIVFLY